MTPERAKHLLPIIDAFAHGRTVQIRSREGIGWSGWVDALDLSFHDPRDMVEYRLKPEPKVWHYAICATAAGPFCTDMALEREKVEPTPMGVLQWCTFTEPDHYQSVQPSIPK